MRDPDIQREQQIASEQEQDWPTWTERALAQLWTEFGHELPYNDAAPQGTEASKRGRTMTETQGFQVKARDHAGNVHDERWTADATILPGILADLHYDPHVAEAWVEQGGEPFDPEMLEPVQKIRYAEQLIRRDHRVVEDDYLFWGNIADHLNWAATIPERMPNIPGGWSIFNRAQDMATGYIRMPHKGEAQ